MTYWIPIALLSTAISFFATRLVMIQLGKHLLDTPNNRSSHSQPTPRGGGLGILISCIFTYICVWVLIPDQAPDFFLVAIPVTMGILGLLDDFFNLGIRSRLFIQFALALAGTYYCITATNWSPIHLILISGLLVPLLIWSTNLYNFMDGINGIAALQAISTCTAMSGILIIQGVNAEEITLLVIIGFAGIGFLYWNFPNAKIFMGDTGSLFLGCALGLLAVKTSIQNPELATAWLIIMAFFISDATYTLCVRLFSGQKFYLPHRSHSYQKLALRFGSHSKPSLLVFAINVLWLFPLALLSTSNHIHPILALTLAYGPLIIMSTKLKAGKTIN
jgi:Fuc2NAc and GlcNAc transferase